MLLPGLFYAANLTVDVSFDLPPEGVNQAALAKLDYGFVSTAGANQLPVKTINVLLPANAEVANWRVNFSAPHSESGSAPLRNIGFSNGEVVINASANRESVNSYSYLGQKKWGELNYASFALLPAIWNGESWLWSANCSIGIEYQAGKTAKGKLPATFKQTDFFANQQQLGTWYQASKDRETEVLVIGTQAMFNALSSWVSYRQAQGIIVSFTDIAVALAQGVGTDDAAKLRSYLQTEFAANPFAYLLLLGDYDVVPVAYVTPEPDGLDTVPTDFFYSDLSSNWDSDNDGLLGEYSTGYMNQDYGVDFTPEAYVGRISTNNASQVTTIANRIVAFEQSSAAWKNNNLLPAAWLNYHDEPDLNMLPTDGAVYMEYLKHTALSGQYNFSLYEQDGVIPSLPSDLPLTYDNFKTKLSSESWGFVNWSAHGSSSSSSRKVWNQDYNDNNLPDSDEMDWQNLINRQSFDNLSNTDGTVIFAASCYNGMIDTNNTCLGEYSLIKKAVGVFAATRTGWYKVGWINPGWGGLSSYNYHLVENYRQNKTSIGAAQAYANLLHSQYYLFGDPIDAGGIIWPELQNIYTYLLFGDPMVGYTPEPNLPNGEILVWEPVGSEGLPVVNAIREVTKMNVIYSDKLIVDYDYLNNFEAVFCLINMPPNSEPVITDSSLAYSYLLNYLNNGGKLYIEGYLDWSSQTALWQMLGAEAPYSGITHISTIRHLASDMTWVYTAPEMYVTMLEPYAATALPLFRNQTGQTFEPYIAIWNTNGSYRSVASSFLLSKVGDAEYSLNDMVGIICDTLNVIDYQPVSNEDAAVVPMVEQISIYPNPSFAETNISFKLQSSAPATIEVYNLKGQKVKALFSGNAKIGLNSFVWDGTNQNGQRCSSGIYLYRIKIADRNYNAKQVIIY